MVGTNCRIKLFRLVKHEGGNQENIGMRRLDKSERMKNLRLLSPTLSLDFLM